jgi:hypothetical protein
MPQRLQMRIQAKLGALEKGQHYEETLHKNAR